LKALLKKEWLLCFHPTSIIFLLFSAFVFIPNYPYEVMFFFSGLSVFFICLTARENGDATFSCTLPVRKGDVAVARMLTCGILQLTLLCLAAVTTTVKQAAFTAEAQVNMAGIMANTAFLGEGAFLLGVFNLVFFPLYFRNVQKVGVPFLIASVAVFLLIGVSIALRFALPFVRDVLNTPDPANMGAKVVVLLAGLCLYALFTAVSSVVSRWNFERNDLS